MSLYDDLAALADSPAADYPVGFVRVADLRALLDRHRPAPADAPDGDQIPDWCEDGPGPHPEHCGFVSVCPGVPGPAAPDGDREAVAQVLMEAVLIPGPARVSRDEGLVLTESEARAAAARMSDWLAARDRATAERIAQAIEAMSTAQWVVLTRDSATVTESFMAGVREATCEAARIARAGETTNAAPGDDGGGVG